MGHDYKNKRLIYHLTAISNIESILINGLKSRYDLHGGDFEDIADPNIISYRQENFLDRYVPFHFFAPTPFAGAVQKSYPDDIFVYIAINRTYARNHYFLIIPKHPMSEEEKFNIEVLNYDEGFEKIEWDVMDQRDYLDAHCKQVCLAECLSPVPLDIRSLINSGDLLFFVRNKAIKAYLNELTEKTIGIDCSYIIKDIEGMFINNN